MTGEPLVELIDEQGRTVGTAGKLGVHRPPGALHRAVSVFLLDNLGRLLLQRRSASKYHSGGLWSNTCCGHPLPGEPPEAAAQRRLREELGIQANRLIESAAARYRVIDSVSGLVEHEHSHVFVGRVTSDVVPNPHEVEDWRLVALDDLPAMRRTQPFTAWFPYLLRAVAPGLR